MQPGPPLSNESESLTVYGESGHRRTPTTCLPGSRGFAVRGASFATTGPTTILTFVTRTRGLRADARNCRVRETSTVRRGFVWRGQEWGM